MIGTPGQNSVGSSTVKFKMNERLFANKKNKNKNNRNKKKLKYNEAKQQQQQQPEHWKAIEYTKYNTAHVNWHEPFFPEGALLQTTQVAAG